MKVNTSQRLQQLMSERNLKQKDILELSKKFQKGKIVHGRGRRCRTPNKPTPD